MRCGSCQAEHEPAAAFCGHCGAVVGWTCPGCSRANATDANYCIRCGTARPGPTPQAGARAVSPPRAETTAELRQVTFMYVDMVGSTALSDRLDPEAYSDAVVGFRDAVGGPIARNGGTIGNFTGDGILAYFGYPRAASNDAARAVRAALDIVAALRAAESLAVPGVPRATDVRIGLHTGLSVIGSLEGAGVIESNAAVGRAANVAARVQAEAAPGQVVITDATLRLVRPHFNTRSLGLMTLKGLSDPIELHEVLAPTNLSPGLRRPLHHGAAIRGRELERMVLQERWHRAIEVRGSAILISGEAGIGKSRLVRDFIETNVGADHGTALIAECLGQRSNSMLQPFRELLGTRLGPIADKTPEEVEQQIAGGLALAPAHRASLRHFMLGTTPDLATSPTKMREDLIAALVGWIEAQQRDRPLALLVEDLHWADDSTMLLLEQIISLADSMKVLVLATARDEFVPPAGHEYHLSKLRLLPLDQAQARDLLGDVAGAHALPQQVVDMVVSRAGGNPLFLEELGYVWLERAEKPQQSPRAAADIPPSLRDALMERLDRLGDAKGLAQLAAILGQTFPIALLEACEDGSLADIRRNLALLMESSIIRPRRTGADAEYEFRHALVRDVAHDSVLPRRRAAYHNRIAEVIRGRFAEIAARRPEVLAWHLQNAARHSEAIDAWLAAGRLAASLSANVEALAHLDHARTLLRENDALPARAPRLLDVLLAMGGPLIARHGWAADPVDGIYREAIDICQSLGDERRLFDVLRGRQNVLLLRGDLARCQEISHRLLRMAENSDDDVLFLEARRGLGVCAFLAGRFEEAIAELDASVRLFNPARHDRLAAVYGVNPGVVASSWRAWAKCLIGEESAAVAGIEAALAMARQAHHPFSEGYALCFAASILQSRNDAVGARRYCELAIELAQQRGYPYWRAWAGIVRGWTTGVSGEPSRGLEELGAALSDYESSGARMIVGYAHALAADVALSGNMRETAMQHLRAADEAGRQTGMRYCQGLLESCQHKLDGRLPQ